MNTNTTNPTKEVTMSTARTITLRSDLPMRGGVTIPAGIELTTDTVELAHLVRRIKTMPQMGHTLNVAHPLCEGAKLAVPTGYIAGYRELLQEALQPAQ
jgi:hypothetical protein